MEATGFIYFCYYYFGHPVSSGQTSIRFSEFQIVYIESSTVTKEKIERKIKKNRQLEAYLSVNNCHVNSESAATGKYVITILTG